MTDKDDEQALYTDIRRAAMNKLARREHSLLELDQKLSQRFSDKALRKQVLIDLQDDGLLSDERFAETYARSRAYKGYGADRILMELSQKGVDDGLANRSVNALEVDWSELLEQQFEKKYRSCYPETAEEKAKYIRFFLYRGFSHTQIKALLG